MEGLLASIGLKLFDKTLGWIIQPLREIFLRRRSQHLVRRASGRKIGILIARIDGDTLNGSLRETIRETIRRELGDAIEIVSWPTSLVIDDGHEQDSEQGAYLKAQSWLTSKNCDLLVWGRIKGTNVVSLRFTLANIGSVRAETYKLTETFDLPIEFLVRLGSALAVRILSMTLPAAKESGKYLVPAMREIASRLEPLIQHPNATLNKSALGALFESYALARKTIGEQTTSPDDLVVALTFYRAAGNEYPREQEPLAWAMTQNNIGLTLWSLGRYQGGDEPFREAIVAYHDALEAITTQYYPQEWALIQNNLGLALWASGERRNDAIQLEQAVTAFRQSLTYCKQEQSPLQWARIQNNLGSTLAILGDREVGVQRLNEAVAAFREALKQRQRNLVPLDWAMTQSNLALALRKLGERESNSALLCEAVTSCHEALTEFTRDRAPLDWARVKICLGNVLFTIGKIETGSNRLKDAVREYRQALEE